MYVTSILISNFLLTAQTQSSVSACSPLPHKRRSPFPQIIKRIHRKCNFWWKLRGVRDAFCVCASLCRDVRKSQVYMNSASLSLPQAADCISTQPWGCWAGEKHTRREKRERKTHFWTFQIHSVCTNWASDKIFFWWKFRGFVPGLPLIYQYVCSEI